jgi:hypothetical protein
MIPAIVQLLVCVVAFWAVAYRRTRVLVLILGCAWTSDFLAIEALGPNVKMGSLVGLLLLPEVGRGLWGIVKRDAAARYLAWELVWAVALGICFGALDPWPDLSGGRLWSQLSAGRALVSVIRRVGDLAGFLYLVREASSHEKRLEVVRGLTVMVLLNVGVALLEEGVGFRMVAYRLPNASEAWTTRPGGLNVEPRELGRVCAVGVLVGLCIGGLPLRRRVVLVSASSVGIVVSGSGSAVGGVCVSLLVIAGIAVLRRKAGRSFALAGFGAAFVILMQIGASTAIRESLEQRRATLVEAEPELEWEPRWMAKLEVFDRAAARFLWKKPLFAIIGAGPDLVSLPASEWIDEKAAKIYGDRIDSVPHTGLLWVISSTGMVGLSLWVWAVRYRLRELWRAGQADDATAVAAVAAFSALVFTPALLVMLATTSGAQGEERMRRRSWTPFGERPTVRARRA